MSAARDFLVELGTEELPPKALPEFERAFAEGIRTALQTAGLQFAALRSYAAPRRLAVLVTALTEQQPAQEIKRRGPPVNAAFDAQGAPTRAGTAFAESCGVAIGALTRAKEGKGEFLFYTGSKAGRTTAELLPEIVSQSLAALPIPKRMRWGASDAEFVRPVHWLLMLFGNEHIATRILDTESGTSTRGHRFHAPAAIAIREPALYAATLRDSGYVLADFTERRARIVAEVSAVIAKIQSEAKASGWRAIVKDELLEEVTALVEWPVAVSGQFDERFLALPREVLIATLQDHQRYFPVEDSAGALLPWFITISNIASRDPSQVRAGNERVVRPRLSDAAFFWEQDRKTKLAERCGALDKVTFQGKLGSVGDKTRRVQQLAAHIASLIGADVAATTRAAELAKCDLITHMVGEFPELQGTMGRYYARADGEPAAVADAIAEHYLPRGAGDLLPSSPSGMSLALADKLDTLAGIFAIGQKPSGTKDPFALRRAAIGVLRIMLERKLPVALRDLIDRAVSLQPVKSAEARKEIAAFFNERLRALLLEQHAARGMTGDVFDAVAAVAPSSPLDFEARTVALLQFLQLPAAASLTAANKRSANILKKSAAPASESLALLRSTVNSALLREPAEKALAAALAAQRQPISAAIAAQDYASALQSLATLRGEVDSFFDAVMVNDPDIALRDNRLALLGELRALFTQVADLSRLPG